MELIKVQVNIMEQLQKSKVNLKKCPKDRLSQTYLETRLENLEEKWTEFNNNHIQIIKECSAETLVKGKYSNNELYDNTEEFYLDFKTELKQMLKTYQVHQQTISNVSTEGTRSLEYENQPVKLPRITIPTFSGIYAEWITFRDLFTSLIHNNKSLDNVQKLHYLKSHLSGDAEQLLRHIPITEANYLTSWTKIQNRYNNKQYLVDCILKRFFNHKAVLTESARLIKQLLDTTNDTLNALRNLDIDVSTWDVIIIYIVTLKLDSDSRKQWELKVSESVNKSENLPTLNQLLEFLENKFRSLEFLEPKGIKPNYQNSNVKSLHIIHIVCPFCKADHKLSSCKQFSNLDCDKRRNFVQTKGLCFNCLGKNHVAKDCHIATTCRICRRKHHSLLHPKRSSYLTANTTIRPDQVVAVSTNTAKEQEESSTNINNYFSEGTVHHSVLLATALFKSESRNGSNQLLRALLDQGSQASFITEAAVQLLGLKKTPVRGVVSGLGGDESIIAKSVVKIKVMSLHDPNVVLQIQAYVLRKLTSFLPVKRIEITNWPEVKHLQLADPNYQTPNKIDVLLGAEVYGQILREGLVKHPSASLIAQNTILGWMLSGSVPAESNSKSKPKLIVGMHVHLNEDDLLKKFWEIESDQQSTISNKILTQEEQECEDFYRSTTRRDEEGRYIVRLPFRERIQAEGCKGSKNIATNRFYSLERKLEGNPNLKVQYSRVMQEYLDLGHMEIVDHKMPNEIYLPHHAVVRDDKETTKLRVVFDASCKGYNGISLNDMLMVGPTLQSYLRHIVMKWRLHEICLVADVVKMYRQIKVADQDADFQRVVWRNHSKENLQEFKLQRITFGTASAPYLAVRTLHQIAYDEGKDFPKASELVLNDFYMDDLMTGCESVEEAIEIYNQMNELLRRGGFQLQKWSSNNSTFLEVIKAESRNEETENNLEIKLDTINKILGLTWNRKNDEFEYEVRLPSLSKPITKRKVISDIARLFDPLGWMSPCIIKAKIFIQTLWIAGVQWDEELPEDLLKEWLKYRTSLLQLQDFRIPRWLSWKKDSSVTELHGFSDASNKAYAAVVYMRMINSKGEVDVNIITAKTKVSPIKQISIPRLELCGAVLLARLLQETSEVLGIQKLNVHAWTDSEVVLAWLSSHPSRWKTFVGNRVSEILTILDRNQWSHIQSKDNPADCASRGIDPHELINNSLWLKGPLRLQKQTLEYSKGKNSKTNLEEKAIKAHAATVKNHEELIWSKYSSLRKWLRIVAYCRRFLKALDKYKIKYQNTCPSVLSKEEIDDAFNLIIRKFQRINFSKEIEALSTGNPISKKSQLSQLNPFIDEVGILRVGGRIQNSNYNYERKHPIIIPHRTHLTNILIADAHERTLHGGPQLMLNYLRSKYWILRVKTSIRLYYRKCVTCLRFKRDTKNQLMGQLPPARVTPNRPFLNSGVDYAGPVDIRTTKGRGYRSYKGYICLFVCMATRAIHLEAVSDLTTQGFLAAFKRFIARRGHCSNLWSDNGTNFVGAARELSSLFAKEKSRILPEIVNWLSNNGTKWHFIPPHTPNFGGLWEAGIKSTKYHLRRVIGNATLTFEEMSTVLCQVEACLNSRPISYINEDKDDPVPLTPGHFLVGESLVIAPDVNYETSTISTLKRWQLCQKRLQDFWRRWSKDYLNQFLQRRKWTHTSPQICIGDVVIVKEDDLPPAKWLLGRVTETHPGSDKITRVVTLRYKDSFIKRPVSKLCRLPINRII